MPGQGRLCRPLESDGELQGIPLERLQGSQEETGGSCVAADPAFRVCKPDPALSSVASQGPFWRSFTQMHMWSQMETAGPTIGKHFAFD